MFRFINFHAKHTNIVIYMYLSAKIRSEFIILAEIFHLMQGKLTVLYIHGMGGGGDSRIPSILRENINSALPPECPFWIDVVVRTYSFDPRKAWTQIESWIEELRPDLIAGESLGSLNAIRIKGLPHVLVSPSLNAPLYLGYLAPLALIPGVTWLFDRIYFGNGKPDEFGVAMNFRIVYIRTVFPEIVRIRTSVTVQEEGYAFPVFELIFDIYRDHRLVAVSI